MNGHILGLCWKINFSYFLWHRNIKDPISAERYEILSWVETLNVLDASLMSILKSSAIFTHSDLNLHPLECGKQKANDTRQQQS